MQRVADAWHDGLVQVDGRPIRDLRRALNALQRLEGFLQPGGLAQANMHRVLRVGGTREADPESLSRDLRAQAPDFQWCLVLKLLEPRRPHTALVAWEPVANLGQCALEFIPGSVECSGRPKESHVVLQPNPREPVGCRGVQLGEGVLQPEHEHNLLGP